MFMNNAYSVMFLAADVSWFWSCDLKALYTYHTQPQYPADPYTKNSWEFHWHSVQAVIIGQNNTHTYLLG